jgi:hypothetical protein
MRVDPVRCEQPARFLAAEDGGELRTGLERGFEGAVGQFQVFAPRETESLGGGSSFPGARFD